MRDNRSTSRPFGRTLLPAASCVACLVCVALAGCKHADSEAASGAGATGKPTMPPGVANPAEQAKANGMASKLDQQSRIEMERAKARAAAQK